MSIPETTGKKYCHPPPSTPPTHPLVQCYSANCPSWQLIAVIHGLNTVLVEKMNLFRIKKTEDRLSRSPVYQVEKSFASVDRLSGRIWSLPCSHLFPSTQPPFVSFCTSRLFCVALWNCTTSTPTVPHMCTVAAIPQHVYCTTITLTPCPQSANSWSVGGMGADFKWPKIAA